MRSIPQHLLILLALWLSACTPLPHGLLPGDVPPPTRAVTPPDLPTTAPTPVRAVTPPDRPTTPPTPAPGNLRASPLPDPQGLTEKLMTSPPVTSQPAPQQVLDQALDDLAARLSIPREEITFLSFETVTWRDSSLGCPRPGMRYLQVITEGYRLRLQAQGQVYAYHGASGRPPFLCVKP